jgi:hypothetical protein
MGGVFYDHPLIHNHGANGFQYRYPLIQYKILNDVPTIVSAGEGNEVVQQIFTEVNEIELINKKYPVVEKNLRQQRFDYGEAGQYMRYELLTPWIPLNQENFAEYKQMGSNKSRVQKLKRILIGNILSQAKGFDYWVEDRLKVKLAISETSEPVQYKGVEFIGFTGYFLVNFHLPDYLGLGKAVSHGFGTIKRMEM